MSSDSEDFESADEDFDSPKASNKFSQVNQSKTAKQSEETCILKNDLEENSNNNTTSNKEFTNLASVQRTNKEDNSSEKSNDSGKNFEIQKKVENRNPETCEETCKTEEIASSGENVKIEKCLDTNINTCEPIEESSDCNDIGKIASTKCVSSTEPKTQKEFKESQQQKSDSTLKEDLSIDNNNKADNDNEGWDFEDWGGGSEPEEETIENKPKQDQETDEWSDFGEWGDDDDSPKKQLPQTDTKTKYEKDQQNLHTFNTFPVLNELSPNRNRPVQEPTKDEQQSESNFAWGWKPWGGVVSLISSASEGVSSLTSHVSQVIENSMGVPSPEEMIKIQKDMDGKEKNFRTDAAGSNEKHISEIPKEDKLRQSFGTIVSGVTNIGSKVLSGGLDTLEGIGKKTMTILQENDPLLLNKRKMLGLDQDKPVLSQILREAKEKSEQTEKNLKQMQKHAYKKQLHFETLFDHYHGLVHLEALEMLSKQSGIKLQSLLDPLTGNALAELQETLDEVKELCELGDFDTEETDGMYDVSVLSQGFADAVVDLGVNVDFKAILGCWKQSTEWIESNGNVEAQDIYDKALRCLAETSANAVHIMHKLAEMLLIKDHHSTANEADSLVQLTTAFCSHLYGVANRFGSMLNKVDSSEEISSLITSIFLEQTNSITYIQSAFQLFIPILQIGAA